MRIQVASDLHLEMMKLDKQNRVMESLLPLTRANAIVLAGDILNPNNAEHVLQWFTDHYKDVIFVTGNHEYAGWHVWETDDEISRLSVRFGNLHHLYPERGAVSIQGQRFVGGTLWYPINGDAMQLFHRWFDHVHIKDFSMEYVHELNKFTVQKFNENILEGDVVVTHMAPTYLSVAEKYKMYNNNCFFANRLEELIFEKKPKLWIHGHMHDRVDYTLGETRVIANPRGYRWMGEGEDFDPHFVLEV